MTAMLRKYERFLTWEMLLLVALAVIMTINALQTPFYLRPENQINLFQLSIEKIILALVMTFIIINAEIDLSVASIMGLAACSTAYLWVNKLPMEVCVLGGLLSGVLAGAFNGFMVSKVGLPSLVVTLAGLIGYRGLARVLLEDRSVGQFPEWFNNLGQQPIIGPFPVALIIFFVLLVIAIVILQYSGFGRLVYVVGNNKDVARFSGVNVGRVKMMLYIASGFIAALAGLLYTARLGAVRGDTALGFELDVITMVLMGGVSIFGGSGSIWGVLLSILIILNVRNGMGLANISGNMQTGVIGMLLILSVLLPNIARETRAAWNRRAYAQRTRSTEESKGG
jgi:rhamnose transport system permease protein